MLGWSASDLPLLLILPALLVASGFFSGSETAYFSLRAHDRATLRRRTDAPAAAAMAMLRQPRVLLVTLLLGNMLINVIYFVISSVLLLRIEAPAGGPVIAILGSLLVLLFIILFGEVFPKLIAARITMPWVTLTAAPLYAIYGLARPVTSLLSRGIIMPLVRVFAPAAPPTQLNFDELDSLLRISADEGTLSLGERELLGDVVGLGRRKVRDVMTPRVTMTAAPLGEPYDDLARDVRRSRERWIPIYEGDVDHIVGVLDAREFLHREPPRVMKRFLHDPVYTPELATLDHALDQLQRAGSKVAVVVDEFGQTAGVVTAADVLRSLFRIDISENERRGDEQLVLTQLGRWEAPGSLSVRNFEDYFGVRFGEDLRISTIAGYLVDRLGRVPEIGESLDVEGYRLTVTELDGQRITRVGVEMLS